MRYTVRPISDRTWIRGEHQRKQSRFDSPWSYTQALLAKEIDHLHGRDIVIEVDVEERHIRLDGMMPASHMTSDEAWSIVGSFHDRPVSELRVADIGTVRAAHKKARTFAHPDRHDGDQKLWDQVEQAAKVLGLL
jgi:hypothetical protein